LCLFFHHKSDAEGKGKKAAEDKFAFQRLKHELLGCHQVQKEDDKRKISFIDSRAQLEQIVFRVKEINQRLMNKFDYVFCK
jgi:predicted transcriptional regulator